MASQDAHPRVSVIVGARNAEATLPGLLASLEKQTVDRDLFEVLVVDDASSDSTPAIVEASGIARLISPPTHLGLFGAQNLAIGQARGELIGITDADCEAAPEWIAEGIAAIDGGADVVAGRYVVPLGDRPSVAALVDATHYYDQERQVSEGYAAGANLWARRQVFDRIGGFDASLLTGGDTDWTQRAVAAGFDLRYAPDMWVAHPALRSARQLVRRMYQQGIGAAERGHSHVSGRLKRPGRAYVGHDTMAEQLERIGVEPTRLLLLRMHLVKNVFIRVPLLAGNVVGAVRRRRSRRAAAQPSTQDG